METWRRLGLIKWSDEKKQQDHKNKRLRKYYGRYFKMMSEGVACEVVRIRMRRDFVGDKVISAVIKCWKEGIFQFIDKVVGSWL